MWVATVGVVGALLGAVTGAMLNHVLSTRSELRRWEREERIRWDNERRACYARFLNMSRTVLLAYRDYGRIRLEDGAGQGTQLLQADIESLTKLTGDEALLGGTHQELLLLASASVSTAADAVINVVGAARQVASAAENLDDLNVRWKQLLTLFDEVIGQFIAQARSELAVR